MHALKIAAVAIIAGLCAFAPRPDVCACALAPPAGASVHIAEESALILWDAATRTQHFIRRAQFDTKAKDFGFLVPTPTRPALSEVDDAVFGYLLELTRPPVRPVARQEVAKGEAPKSATRKSAPPPAVIVLEAVTVAGLDAVVLEANDAQALDRWLRGHGYASSPVLAEWFKPYIAAKWIMTAFKISKGQSRAERAVSSAVRMSFKTERPFFPYREPASDSKAPRALEVYFVSGERVEGTIGAGKSPEGMLDRMKEWVGLGATSRWSGSTLWAKPLTEGARNDLLGRAKLPGGAVPAKAWLTRFLDSSAPRPGTDELYFARAGDQSEYLDADRLESELERKQLSARQVAYSAPPAARSAPGDGGSTSGKALTRSEREAMRDAEAADPYRQALALENDGRAPEAIRLYRRAARAGNGQAAKRLWEIFDKGAPGVSRDFAESLQWAQTARDLGVNVEPAGKR